MIKRLVQRFSKPKRRTQAQRMITLNCAPAFYLPITKSGSTYLKNLFYYLDHAEEHEAGLDIHSNPEDMLRARSSEEDEIRDSRHAFAVLRDPVDRFLSLYFDKIYGDGPRNFPDVRHYLSEEIALDLSPDLGVDEHRENCHRLIDWLALNLDHKTDQPVNHHWRRQSSRLKRVDTLNLTYLTLEGLNWQLPLLLSDILPNIRQAMSAVTIDNRTIKPFSRTEILNATLLDKIETTYSYDKALYDKAKQDWQPWRKDSIGISDTETLRCFSTSKHPINCVVTLKAGGTYLRNLLYTLEHGKPYDTPLKIHTKGVSATSDLTKTELEEQVSFFVVRDPAERLLSLYFDKVYGTGEQSFAWVTERLVKYRGFVRGDNLSIEQHQNNILGLLDYIGRKFTVEELDQGNQHWRSQVEVLDKAIQFGLRPLLLENVEQQLIQIAEGRIDGLEAAIKTLPHRNSSKKSYTTEEIMTPEIARRISVLYGGDQALYERVKVGWRETGYPPKL